MCNSSDQSCPKATSGGGGGGAVGQQDVFLLLQPLRPPLQYFFFPPATSTTTAPPFQHRLETTSRQLIGTNSSNNNSSSTSSNVRFVHGARYLKNLYPYCYDRNGHGIRKQPDQLCFPVMNPTSYAMASAAELNKKRLRVDGDQNGIVHINSANTNAVYPNSSRPIPSTSTRSPATINFTESLSPSSSGPGLGGGLYCTNMQTGIKRKRDDNTDRLESKESTDIDLELKL